MHTEDYWPTPTVTKARNVNALQPPTDGDISNFTVEQIAGMMKHLKFSDRTVENALAKNIDGIALCRMKTLEDDELRDNLKLDADVLQVIAMRHYIDKSTNN